MRKLVTVAALSALFSAPIRAQDDFELFYGLLHAHTHFSDGRGDPNDAYDAARNAGLDFFAITEHNHSDAAGGDGVFLTPPLYQGLKNSAEAKTQDHQFVALFGQEVSSISKGNHVNVFNASSIVDIANGDFRDLYDRYLRDHTEVPVIQFNHPNVSKDQSPRTNQRKRHNDYGIDDYNQSFNELVAAADQYVGLIEMIVGPAFNEASNFQHRDGRHQDDYVFYLNQGFRLGPSAGQDNHHENWGRSTEARMGAWAEELTVDGIYEALAARRTYATEDRNLSVKLKLGETWMGDAARLDGNQEVTLSLSFSDEDEDDAEYGVALFYDSSMGGESARIVDFVNATGDQTDLALTHDAEIGGYYFVKITQRSDEEFDPDDAWTSPIWIAAAEDPDPGEEHTEEGIVDWEDAPDFVGQAVTVRGEIVDHLVRPTILFLNFDEDFRETLTLVVFESDLATFGGADALVTRLLGNEVTVRGEISEFRGRPQMILKALDQIIEPNTP